MQSRFQWDMDAYTGALPMYEMRARRLIVRGLTEAQVIRIWGKPQERVVMPPSYKSITYDTRGGWLTVVFDRGRVTRVEEISRRGDPEESPGTSRMPAGT